MDDPLAKFKQEIAMSELEMIENDEIENGSTENNNFTADMLGGAASRFPNSALFSSINANVTNVTQKVYSNLDKLRKKTDNPGTKK